MATQSRDGLGRIAQEITFPVGLFATVGAGVGVTASLILSELDAGGGSLGGAFFLLVVIVFTVLLGPPLAAVVGLRIADRDGKSGYVTGALGSGVGYIAMVLIVLFVISMRAGNGDASGGSESLDVFEFLLPAIGMALPTAGVATVSMWLSLD